MKQYPHLETERDGAVMIIRLANEASRNSLSREMRFSLRDVVREIQDDRSVRAVYLTGKGPSFCAGGDLNMLTKAHAPWAVHRRFRHANTLLPPLLSLDRPVVCGVRGQAIGGGMGLALMSDLIVAGESAQFMAGFFRIGAVPDCLTLYTLPRLIGLARTRNFLLMNGSWDAAEAKSLGVVAKVVPDDEVDKEGLALAHSLSRGPAEVMGLSKLLMLKSFESSVDDLMMYEGLGQALAMSGAEFQEGLAALIEKRKPDHLRAALADPITDGLPATES
ncbi:MAG TPA: enoyl-CoA hydratase/isomerase family protein [Ramlibacter sp.]|nr:enoyl-CoA hydratase/isomerase family protein [Ramlibacter sp.]